MVEQGSASVSGVLFIPPKSLPTDFDEAAMKIVLALPQRLGQSVMEHVGSTKYWALTRPLAYVPQMNAEESKFYDQV